jgi:nucleotide-binding universal stress UspA family protein
MKTIVVAIDFSKGSIYALRYAINIANYLKANIQMVWVDKAASMRPVYLSNRNNYLLDVKNKFEELINKYRKKLPNGKIEYKIRKGKVYTEVVNQAKYSDAELIIAGTHGASGFEEFWIGSNAYKIVASSPCPVITIRFGYCFLEPASKILLPIDDTIDTRQKVPFTTELAKAFGAGIMVLSLYESSVKEEMAIVDKYSKQAVNYINNKFVKVSLDTILCKESVPVTVIDYAKKQNIDLISIMTEQEVTASDLFLGSSAQRIVNHSSIPVLSIHATEIFDIATR